MHDQYKMGSLSVFYISQSKLGKVHCEWSSCGEKVSSPFAVGPNPYYSHFEFLSISVSVLFSVSVGANVPLLCNRQRQILDLWSGV